MDMSLDTSRDYWTGANWMYHATVTNGAGGAGNQSYTLTPGTSNELEILYGVIFNGDSAGRVATVEIDTGTAGETLAEIVSVTADAGSSHSFPHSDVAAAGGTHLSAGPRIFLSGGMRLVATVAAVAASEDSAFGLVCRIRGPVPTVVEAGASTPTIVIDEERTI